MMEKDKIRYKSFLCKALDLKYKHIKTRIYP